MQRSYFVNDNIRRFVLELDKKPTAVADRASIRRDVFSRILNNRRPVYADELLPIAKALGVSVDVLVATGEVQQ